MVTALVVLAVLAVLFVAATVATHDGDVLQDAPRDVADVELPVGPLGAGDLEGVRFSMALRGYRMSEVDAVLERVADELSALTERVRELEDGAGQAPGEQQRTGGGAAAV